MMTQKILVERERVKGSRGKINDNKCIFKSVPPLSRYISPSPDVILGEVIDMFFYLDPFHTFP